VRAAGVSVPGSVVEALLDLAVHEEPWLRAVGAAALLRVGLRGAELPRREGEDDPRVRAVLSALPRESGPCPN
jgi:hypothetical protein